MGMLGVDHGWSTAAHPHGQCMDSMAALGSVPAARSPHASLSTTPGTDRIDLVWFGSSRTGFISAGSPDNLIHGSAIPEWS